MLNGFLFRFSRPGIQILNRQFSKHQIPKASESKNGAEFSKMCTAINLQPKIGFLGGGMMAQALAKGFCNAKLLAPSSIAISEPDLSSREICKNAGFYLADSNSDLITHCKGGIIVAAVKPHILTEVLKELQNELPKQCGLLISVAAGVPIRSIFANLNSTLTAKLPIIRTMPNTPALIGCGATVYCRSENSKLEHAQLARLLFETVGLCYEIPESLIDAANGLSGSGPGFVYTFIDALADGGVKVGLPRKLALSLAAQTVMGAARMVLETNKHPGELKDAVCSPGGTTISGIHALENGNVRAGIISAVESATNRAKQLAAASLQTSDSKNN